MANENIYYCFGVHPQPNGEIHHTLKGKFFLRDGHLSVLEDHGLARGIDLEKVPPAEAAARIRRMTHSQRRMVVNGEDLRQGLHPDLLATTEKPRVIPGDLREAMGKQFKDPDDQVAMYDYHRHGMPGPQVLEIHGSKAYLDGHEVSPEELTAIMSNVKAGKAEVRHSLAKHEGLEKIEPDLANALGHVRSAVQSGHVPPEAYKQLSRSLFTDTLVPTVGNRKAYQDFLSRPKNGIHVRIDMNDFGDVNKVHGHETGNQAIIAAFRAAREAADESVGRKNAKLFRIGGDEGHLFVPSTEHAASFARAFRAKLEAIPSIRGTHSLSASIGYGRTPQTAEEALIQAKTQKKAGLHPKGQAPSYVQAHPELLPPQLSLKG